jgi:hypothetical protein
MTLRTIAAVIGLLLQTLVLAKVTLGTSNCDLPVPASAETRHELKLSATMPPCPESAPLFPNCWAHCCHAHSGIVPRSAGIYPPVSTWLTTFQGQLRLVEWLKPPLQRPPNILT